MSKAWKSAKKAVKKVFKNKWVRLAAIAVASYFTAGMASAYFGGLAASGAISSTTATIATGATTGAVAGGLSEGNVKGALKGAAVGGALSGVSVAAKGAFTKTAAQAGTSGSSGMSTLAGGSGYSGGGGLLEAGQAAGQSQGSFLPGAVSGVPSTAEAVAGTGVSTNVAASEASKGQGFFGKMKQFAYEKGGGEGQYKGGGFLKGGGGGEDGESVVDTAKNAWGNMGASEKLLFAHMAMKTISAYTAEPPPTPWNVKDTFDYGWQGVQQPDFLQQSPQEIVGGMQNQFLPG